jgi:hypothetical protein
MITPLVSSNCGVIIGRKLKKDRQCHGHTKLYIEQFDDTNANIICQGIISNKGIEFNNITCHGIVSNKDKDLKQYHEM